ncbi:transcription initiation factor TFIID subunit 7-like isoform X1 [Pyrus x bretschneideri]|uniref:transcription initiation factor TFIID subunit 7-like isoform X1 n=1 Tax=Pyrus x bretschneideri TaxID=225117 RepID=UPI00202E9B72|nr:transcription initiation factor TFIID subunit 7-like isoform X1 [Pyrus x bretschneideri]
MEEQFVLRVPPSVAERLDRLLGENASTDDKSLDLSFEVSPNVSLVSLKYLPEDGRTGTFVIGNDRFPASLFDLPCVVESFKTYDDSVLIKTADIGQMIMVRDPSDPAPDTVEYRHGLTPPMRDARKRRFRREPDLNPEIVRRVEEDLLNISTSGPADNIDVEAAEQEKDGDGNARNASKKPVEEPVSQPDVPEAATNAGDPDRSDSDESDDSI